MAVGQQTSLTQESILMQMVLTELLREHKDLTLPKLPTLLIQELTPTKAELMVTEKEPTAHTPQRSPTPSTLV
jgi:hypothetical protein